jgi:hypothetical protein
LTALADRLQAVRAKLAANADPPGHPGSGGVPAGHTPDGDGAKGEAH